MDAWRIVIVLAILVSGTAAHAQRVSLPAPQFRVQWERRAETWRRPAIEGYVHNDSDYRLGNVRLRVELLDAASQVVGETHVWVYGVINARDRAYFSFPIPPKGETYRMTVESFDTLAVQTQVQSP